MSVPPELMAALQAAQTLQPQAQGNPTGATGGAFAGFIQSAISDLQSALQAAPDQASASTVNFLITRLQQLTQPGLPGALQALGQTH